MPIRHDDLIELRIAPTDAKRIERVVADMQVGTWAALAARMIRDALDGYELKRTPAGLLYPHRVDWRMVEFLTNPVTKERVQERVRVRVTVERV